MKVPTKAPTGIAGFVELAGGGLPRIREVHRHGEQGRQIEIDPGIRCGPADPGLSEKEMMLTKLFSAGKKWAIHAILGSIVFTFILLALLIYKSVDQELTGVALMRRASVANLAAAMLSEKLARVLDIGASLAAPVRFRQLVAERQWADAMGMLRDLPHDLPVIDRVFLANAEGTLMADFPELAGVKGQNFAHRDWYKGVSLAWRPYVSPVYTRAGAPQLNVFAVAVPIPREVGGVAGILVLQVQLESAFFEWTKKIESGPEGVAYIVDQNGQVAFHSKSPVRGKIVDFSAMPVMPQVRQRKEGVHIAVDPAGNEETIFAYASLESSGWSVVTQQPARASLGLLARDRHLTRLLFAYGLLLFLCVSMVFLAYRVVVQRRQAQDDRRITAELERRVAERTVRLEAINKELESFSYSVSHDLRGPLRSMDGFSLVVLEDYGDKLDEEGKDALERIRAASQRMGALIDDLLRLSQVTRAELNVTRVDLSAIAREIADALDREQSGRSVEWAVEAGLGVRADPALMRIAMQNLLQNAWKFTGRTGKPVIRVGALERDARTVYFVADNGAGFDMAHADKLFGPFQRLHHVDDFPGTGIGLAIVQRIIRRHDGKIWAEAKEGEGATFFFSMKESENGSDEQDHPAG
jgi:signal transduction histidine kinase